MTTAKHLGVFYEQEKGQMREDESDEFYYIEGVMESASR